MSKASGLDDGENGDKVGSSKATAFNSVPKVAGLNKPKPENAGSHDKVCRESGSDGLPYSQADGKKPNNGQY